MKRRDNERSNIPFRQEVVHEVESDNTGLDFSPTLKEDTYRPSPRPVASLKPAPSPRPAPAPSEPSRPTNSAFVNQVLKQKLELLVHEKNEALARCAVLQDRLKQLDPNATNLEFPGTSEMVARIEAAQNQAREAEQQLEAQQRENSLLRQQMEALAKQVELLRMARDSAHATVQDLQRRLEDQEHQIADLEHSLHDEIERRKAMVNPATTFEPPPGD